MSGVLKHFHTLDYWQSLVWVEFDVLLKWKLFVKNKAEILLSFFKVKYEVSKTTEVKWRGNEETIWSRKMENLQFLMFNNKPKLFK